MSLKAVNMISGFLQNQMTPGYQTCAEVVLRHWQYTYNNYAEDHEYHPKYPCTQAGLKEILKLIGRHDLCKYLVTSLKNWKDTGHLHPTCTKVNNKSNHPLARILVWIWLDSIVCYAERFKCVSISTCNNSVFDL